MLRMGNGLSGSLRMAVRRRLAGLGYFLGTAARDALGGVPPVYLKELGIRVDEKRVARLMRETGLVARTSRHFRVTTNSKHALSLVSIGIRKEHIRLAGTELSAMDDLSTRASASHGYDLELPRDYTSICSARRSRRLPKRGVEDRPQMDGPSKEKKPEKDGEHELENRHP